MKSTLPPLRALHAFEAFGRCGSVNAAARELGVTAGAVSQQIKSLEEHIDVQLIAKDGRRATLSSDAKAYHTALVAGFDKIRRAQEVIQQQRDGVDLKISGPPTLLLKWLNSRVHRFNDFDHGVPIRLEATHTEPDAELLDHMFRITYGAETAENYAHKQKLFTDYCLPVCSPEFLQAHPEARDPEALKHLPWIDADRGPGYENVPRLTDWFALLGLKGPTKKPVSVHSVLSLALETAVDGQGITLAQSSFVQADLDLGRLVKLSDHVLPLPDYYYICWSSNTLDQSNSRNFLNWILAEGRAMPEV